MAMMTSDPQREDRETSTAPLVDRLSDSLQGRDEPMEENHPLAPAALVFLTYPMMLTLAAIIIVGSLWFFGVLGGAGSTTPAVPKPPIESQADRTPPPPGNNEG